MAEDLYGLFYEDINRSGDGGIYPEMIRNRSFEDSIVPEGCTTDERRLVYINRGGWPGCFNGGEGMDEWAAAVPETSVPGWYTENARMKLRDDITLNSKRRRSLEVEYEKNGRIRNIGYTGIPIECGKTYNLILFVMAEKALTLTARLAGGSGEDLGSVSIGVKPGSEWNKLEVSISAIGSDYSGALHLICDTACRVVFGYTSLLPAETFMGHGLRTDVVDALVATHPKFMRYPGGCIVEGMSFETAMRFSNTIGPAWERPTTALMWHYRTTNGFGYHEFLQLCEDTGMNPLYVCNCGMSCQARVSEIFPEQEVDNFLEEALGALEYAMGGVDTKYGAMRAAAGHPEPFKMTYFEIGNENHGTEYNDRYKRFYTVLKKAYPNVIYISNTHTEKEGLTTEFADEHYYDAPEFFLENDGLFDDYDRNGPKIFLGEYAVNGGNTIASMECALAEAVFLCGVERNQDIVRLTAYAPLLQNADYTAWKPNLVVFNNHSVYGIPTYHAISLMAANRGKNVVESEIKTGLQPPKYRGVPSIMCDKPGLMFRNVRINGEPTGISRKIYGDLKVDGEVYTAVCSDRLHPYTGKNEEWNRSFRDFMLSQKRRTGKADDQLMWYSFGDEEMEEYTFELDIKIEPDNGMTLAIWNHNPATDAGCNEPKDKEWNLFNIRNQVWRIADGKGSTAVRRRMPEQMKEEYVPLNIDYSVFNRYKIEATRYGYRCYINDVLVQEKLHKLHNLVYTVTTEDDDNLYIKLINTDGIAGVAEILLDCDVERSVEAEVLSAPSWAVNSFENMRNVAPVTQRLDIGDRCFSYEMPAYSLNILKVKKRQLS